MIRTRPKKVKIVPSKWNAIFFGFLFIYFWYKMHIVCKTKERIEHGEYVCFMFKCVFLLSFMIYFVVTKVGPNAINQNRIVCMCTAIVSSLTLLLSLKFCIVHVKMIQFWWQQATTKSKEIFIYHTAKRMKEWMNECDEMRCEPWKMSSN